MDFELDEDQLSLQSAAAEVLGKECSADYLRGVVDRGHDPAELWQILCALEWPGLALTEDVGGSGASTVELAIVLEQLGHVADPTAFLATATQFAPVIAAAGSADQRKRFLGPVAAEGGSGTFALAGADGRWDVSTPPVQAELREGSWHLSGTSAFVLDADRVDEVAVLAQTASGPQAFVVPTATTLVTRRTSLDETLHVCDVDFDGVVVDADRHLEGDGPAAFGAALEQTVLGSAVAMVGACQRALEIVIDYVKGREQFGVPIGSFQAVKHKVVDFYVAIERARALAYFAALTNAENDPRAPLAASMAKAAAGDAERIAFRHSIQLHGGIGFTWENDVHLYLRRAQALALLFGGTRQHRLAVGRALIQTTVRPTEVLSGAADVR